MRKIERKTQFILSKLFNFFCNYLLKRVRIKSKILWAKIWGKFFERKYPRKEKWVIFEQKPDAAENEEGTLINPVYPTARQNFVPCKQSW